MRNTIIFLFLPFFAASQNEIVKDSTFIKWESGAWYRVVSQTFDNGNINLYQTFIGDTSALYNQAVDGIRNTTSSMAVDASYTSGFKKRVSTLLSESDEILAKAGKSPADSLEAQGLEPFLTAGWTIKSNDGSTAITFNKTAANKLRYQNVTTTNRQCDLIGSVIRLRDYPTNGTNVDFFKSPNVRRWTSLNRDYQLIPPGGTANK